jgi:hypothetical protein
MTAGSEEPNALVEVLEPGGQVTPNVRATVQEVFPGLSRAARTAGRRCRSTLLAVNDWFASFLRGLLLQDLHVAAQLVGKGLRAAIRRAAGLGSLSGATTRAATRRPGPLRPAGDRFGSRPG